MHPFGLLGFHSSCQTRRNLGRSTGRSINPPKRHILHIWFCSTLRFWRCERVPVRRPRCHKVAPRVRASVLVVRAHAWACASGEHPVSRSASVAAVPSRASLPTTYYRTIAGRCPRDSRRVARRIPLWTRLNYILPVPLEVFYELSSVSDPRIAPDGRTVAVVAWRVDREANHDASAI
jgi:peptidoglycan/xylan/chitin deacetylase (PgdA/CDA1 family)